ncbi:MAG: cysteine--tRNA ligase, partial [Nanoarchaeota archaeon]
KIFNEIGNKNLFINDDLNSSKALSFLWEILRDDKLNDSEKYELAIYFDKIFGLDLDKEDEVEIPEEVKKLLEERKIAREKKDWKKSDELRDKINKLGFVLNDTEKGVEVKRK